MATVEEILHEATALFKERSAAYRDNHERLANTLVAMFPEGITLKTAQDHARFILFVLTLVKQTRYAVQWEHGHQDSIQDAIVYLALLAVWDKTT
jgi:hypothetical protein